MSTKQFKDGAEQVLDALPKVSFNKNGYEIRTNVLDMAKAFTEFEYSNKWNGFEVSAKRDKETGQIINKVDMPEIPSTDEVLQAAEKFYEFVNGKPTK